MNVNYWTESKYFRICGPFHPQEKGEQQGRGGGRCLWRRLTGAHTVMGERGAQHTWEATLDPLLAACSWGACFSCSPPSRPTRSLVNTLSVSMPLAERIYRIFQCGDQMVWIDSFWVTQENTVPGHMLLPYLPLVRPRTRVSGSGPEMNPSYCTACCGWCVGVRVEGKLVVWVRVVSRHKLPNGHKSLFR